MTNGVLAQLDDLERRLSALHAELQELRATVLAPAAVVEPPPARPAAPPPPPAASQRAASQRAATWPPPPPREQAPPKEPSFWDRAVTLPKLDPADLLGARALAWTGGVVTLLGVVLFFVLAVNRGWIGPVERVGLGALASLLVFGSGLLMRHRYGQLYSAVSAVGAGIAGGYATLLAAAALYGLVPNLVALAIAAGIAVLGTAVSLAWKSETVASLGLVGATLVPIAAAFDTEISTLGTAFAGLVFAGAAVVAIRQRWDTLLAAAAVAAVAQVAWLVLDAGAGAPARDVGVAAFFWLVLLAAGLARREARDGESESLSTAFVLASSLLAGIASRVLFQGEVAGFDPEGSALVVVALAYLLLGAGWFRRDRDLSALLGAIGLAVGAVATAELLGGGTLAVAFAAEAALLAWVAYRLVEPRYGFLSLGYLGLAVAHTLVLDAHPRELFTAADRPAADAPVAAVAGLACLIVAFYAPRWKRNRDGDPDGLLEELVGELVAAGRGIGLFALGAGAALLVHASSLGLLEAGVAAGSFDWAEVAVTAFWGAVAAASLVAARRWDEAELYGLAWACAAVAKLVIYDADRLDTQQAGISALALAGTLLTAAILGRKPIAVGLVPVAAVLAGAGAVGLGGSSTSEGLLLLAVAAPFAALAALRFGDRTRSTALWSSALALGYAASLLLLDHTALVAAWAAGAVALAALAELVEERRLQLAAYALTAFSLLYAVAELAPPTELFDRQLTPADGVPALLLALGALVLITRRVWVTPDRDELDRTLAEVQRTLRPRAAWGGAVIAVYAASLTLLGASQELGPDLSTAFQRGHTAISALWGTIGLVALYLGLTRTSSSLRLAGFALFGVSLVKIFAYDLSRLSSVSRALSFLAVGAVLLLAGFFYQRLSTAPASDQRTR